MTKIINFFSNILHFLLHDRMPVAIKYTVPNLPTNIEDLNNNVIQPLVLISLRINLLKLWLNDAKNLFNKEEAHKKNLTGYSQESSRSIETLSTLTKNINILNAELKELEALQMQLSQNYKAYLKLYNLPL
jgi:hypothetical protein